jgi:lipopolysaccharide export system protein LptA
LAKNSIPLKKTLCRLLCLILFFSSVTLWSQDTKQVIIEGADFFDITETEVPGAIIMTGNVRIVHEGVRMTCNKAYHFHKNNFVKAFGNVQMIQGDTLFMNSKYAEYNGNTKFAYATGNVTMRDPKMTLVTDTINFNRSSQEAYYNSKGTITDPENTLTSKSGRYFLSQKKFQFLNEVTVVNPRQTITTNHLDYYTNSGHAYVFGPSTIKSNTNTIYTEKGFYDTKKGEGKLLKASKITYKDRLIEGDDIFYDQKKDYARAKNNVKVTDTINHFIVKGHYAEVYKQKDSMFISKKAVAISVFEKDSVFFHAKKLLITGKPDNRIIRGYNNARFFKKDMSGKCDSIHSNQKTGLTQMMGKPIFWNGKNQMTGDLMHLIGDTKTEKADSLKVLNNAFIISKDTVGEGYNQVKGQNLYGKFKDNKLHEVDVVKNTEVVFYMRNEKNELIGINKNVSSKINMILEGNNIETITFFKDVDGTIYPEDELPENTRKLKGFIWRGDERILTKDDIFPPEELELDKKAQKEVNKKALEPDLPMEPSKETLEFDKPKPASKANTKKKK